MCIWGAAGLGGCVCVCVGGGDKLLCLCVRVCGCVCEGGQPVGPDDAFSHGVSYLVEDVFVLRTADE